MVGQVYNSSNNTNDNYTYQVRPLNRVPAPMMVERADRVITSSHPDAAPKSNNFKTYAMPTVFVAAAAGIIGLPMSLHKGSKDAKHIQSLSEQISKAAKAFKDTLDKVGEKSKGDIVQDAKNLGDIATKDALTGLYNKRAYMSALTKAAEDAKNYKQSTHMGMMDFDFFKSVNDVLGHDVGDKFIARLGANIKAVTEKHDVAGYRFGGEEFGIIMPGKNAIEAKTIIKGVATAIKQDAEIQSHKDLFLATAKKQLAGFKREQEINQKQIWDKIRGPQKEEEQAKLAEDVLTHLLNNRTSVALEDEDHLIELQGLLAGIIVNKQGVLQKMFGTTKPQGITPLPVPEGATVKTLYEKYPIMVKRLGGAIDRKKDIAAWESWITHVEKNGFTISGGISSMAQSGYDAKVFEKKADEALEHAKHSGRNSVKVSGEK